jgi:hypothetical protein
MPKKRLTNNKQNQDLYNKAFQEAGSYGVNLSYFERWTIELNSNGMPLKYKALLLFALTGLHKANALAPIFNYSSERALNEDFSKRVGSLVRTNFGFDDGKGRFGITSIRPACHEHRPELLLVYDAHDSVSILSQRYAENIQLEESSISDKTSINEASTN